MYVSIRTKILGVLSALLVAAIFAYLILADRIFREDKQLLVFDTNRSNAERLAGDVEGSIRRILDKTEILARLALHSKGGTEAALMRDFLFRDVEMMVFQLRFSKDNRVLTELIDEKQAKRLGVTMAQIREAGLLEGFRPSQVQGTNSIYLENVSLPGAALFLLRVPVEVRSERENHDLYAQVLIEGRKWIENFENQTLTYNFAISGSGHVLIHPRAAAVYGREDMSGNELVRISKSSGLPGQQVEVDLEGTRYLGVFQKVGLGDVIVYSLMAKKTALSASLLLLEKTIVLSAIVVTLVLLVSIWFASSLSKPLLLLVDATGEIAQGRFDTKIHVKTHDEIGALADAFDKMAQDLKASRAQLEDYSRSLETKVYERTRELEGKNAAIREQQDVLIRTTRLAAVGEIAGQAAHEVLNPLTGMIARLEAMSTRVRERYLDEGGTAGLFRLIMTAWKSDFDKGGVSGWLKAVQEPSKVLPGKTILEEDLTNISQISLGINQFGETLLSDLGFLQSESFRISRIVDGMRGLSRISQSKTITDVVELTLECVRAIEDLLARNKIQINTEFSGPLMSEIDRDEMRQVFSNLIKNSMEAILQKQKANGIQEGKGLIVISGTTPRAGLIRISIWDNGVGISDKTKEKLFDSQFTTKGADGTGYGLSICRRFVRAAGGDLVLVDSKPNEYTEFEINLPERKHHAEA